MKSLETVSVIIPTIAIKEKGLLLRRAIETIRNSSANPVRIITVVNGNRADAEICQWLKSQPDIHFERLATPSSPLAILRGRELVNTQYFSMLDDDDEYLSGGTDLKLAVFESHPHADIVITSGFRRVNEVDEPAMSSVEKVPSSPLHLLFESTWLSSCNALYRSSSFPPAFFTDSHPYAEWTWLAFKLASVGKQVAATNQPTFRIHDTPGSLSKSAAYHDTYQPLYQRMLDLSPPTEVGRIIRARMSSDWHDQSVRALSRGDLTKAVTTHMRSLTLPGGYQYLAFTRRLIPHWPNS